MSASFSRYSFLYFVLILLFSCSLLQAQNLVPNPGFEIQTSCPSVSEIQKAPPWGTPSLGTPDLYNDTCPSQGYPGRTGIGCAGIFCASFPAFHNSREYIQARLTEPLTSGQNYCVSFYVERATYLYSISTIGAFFSNDSVYLDQTDNLPNTPQVESPAGTQLSSTSSWTEISGNFTATGGESFIIIGNFRDDANTTKVVASSSPDSVSYYYIDDISVQACSANGINEVAANNLTLVYPNPATDVLNIEMATGAETIKSLELYDVLSNRINIQPEYENGKLQARFNISQLASGTYFVAISTETGRVMKKVLIAK